MRFNGVVLRGSAPATSVAGSSTSWDWGSDGRSFWTKRKRTAVSLMAVLSLVAGLAVAYKLFDRTVPNNVVRDAASYAFGIQACEVPYGTNPAFLPTDPPIPNTQCDGPFEDVGPDRPIFGPGVDSYPEPQGSTMFSRRAQIRILNNVETTNSRNIRVLMYFKNFSVCRPQANGEATSALCIEATAGESPVLVPESDERHGRFLSFWRIQQPTGCAGPLTGRQQDNPCVFAPQVSSGLTTTQTVSLQEMDDGTNQSEFKGWAIVWDWVFQVCALTQGHQCPP